MVFEALVLGNARSLGAVANDVIGLLSMILFLSWPRPEMDTMTSSPVSRKTGGLCPKPTPAGYVPLLLALRKLVQGNMAYSSGCNDVSRLDSGSA